MQRAAKLLVLIEVSSYDDKIHGNKILQNSMGSSRAHFEVRHTQNNFWNKLSALKILLALPSYIAVGQYIFSRLRIIKNLCLWNSSISSGKGKAMPGQALRGCRRLSLPDSKTVST